MHAMPALKIDAPPCTPARKITRPSLEQSSKYSLYRHGYILRKTLESGSYAKVKSAHCTKLKRRLRSRSSARSPPQRTFSKISPVRNQSDEEGGAQKLCETVQCDPHRWLCLYDNVASRGRLPPEFHQLDLSKKSEQARFNSMKIFHRDLKCENLLLDSQQRLKISDFGFARQQEGKKLETYCGSRAYAPPEIIMGEPYHGEMADIWSMGVILYAMVAGRLPFKDSDATSLLTEISRRIHFPSRVSDECKDLIQAILTSLQRNV